jgi:hypothetical protein
MPPKKNSKPSIDWNDNLADFKDKVVKGAKNVPIVAQNLKYFNAAQQGPKAVAKTAAVDVAINAAAGGAGKVLGKVLGAVAGKATGAIAGDVSFTQLLPKSMGAGGKVSTVNTPFGKTLASTKIMTKGQTSSAEKGLTKIAENRANEIESGVRRAISSSVSRGVSNAAKNTGIAATAAYKPKNKKDTRKK